MLFHVDRDKDLGLFNSFSMRVFSAQPFKVPCGTFTSSKFTLPTLKSGVVVRVVHLIVLIVTLNFVCMKMQEN